MHLLILLLLFINVLLLSTLRSIRRFFSIFIQVGCGIIKSVFLISLGNLSILFVGYGISHRNQTLFSSYSSYAPTSSSPTPHYVSSATPKYPSSNSNSS